MQTHRVLVTYGSKRGGTAEIAEWIGESLRAEGLDADVQPAEAVADVAPYDAFVIGGALYAMRWHKAARRFVRRHRDVLSQRPVWLFSSGPLDRSAQDRDIPPVRGVTRTAARIGAHGHATFGGRLTADPGGRIATAMAKKSAGDFRSREQVSAWTRSIAGALRPVPSGPA
jgi:menaquinone-dependent protoporphyrinogen oxidase